jgi:propanediol dehydratase small subunit
MFQFNNQGNFRSIETSPETRQRAEAQRWERVTDLLSPDERATITHGLRVASDRFDEDAKVARQAGHPRLAEQFERQAADSRQISDALEA